MESSSDISSVPPVLRQLDGRKSDFSAMSGASISSQENQDGGRAMPSTCGVSTSVVTVFPSTPLAPTTINSDIVDPTSSSPSPALHSDVNPQLALNPEGAARDPNRMAYVRDSEAFHSRVLHGGHTGFARAPPLPSLHDDLNPQLAVAPEGVARDPIPNRMAYVRDSEAHHSLRVLHGGYTGAARAPPHGGRHVGVREFYGDSGAAHVGSYIPVYSPQEEWRRQEEFYREMCYPPPVFHPSFLPYRQSSFHGFSPLPPPSATVTSASMGHSKRTPPLPEGPPPSRPRSPPPLRPRSPPLRLRSPSPPPRHRSPTPPLLEHGNTTNRTPRCPSPRSAYSDVSDDDDDASDRGSDHDTHRPEQRSAFKDAVSFMAQVCPEAVSSSRPSTSRYRTLAESLSSGDGEVSGKSIPKESQLLTDTLTHLECDIAGLPYPDDKGRRKYFTPLATGQFLRVKGDTKTFPSPGPFIEHARLPSHTLSLSGSDARLFSSSSAMSNKRKTSLDDSTLRDFEFITRRGMEAASLASSFLDALTSHLKKPKSDGSEGQDSAFHINPDADPRAVQNFLWASSVATADAMEMLGKMYVNLILARRDAALAVSALKKPEDAAEIRVLPLDSRHLFGPAVETKLKERAEKAKEDRWCMPPAPSTHSQGRQQSNRPFKSQQGYKRKPKHQQSSDAHSHAKKSRPEPKPSPKHSGSSNKKSSSGPRQKKNFQ